MKQLFFNAIKNDIYNLCYSLHIKYNIDLDLLLKTYIPNISFNKPKKINIKIKRFKQCKARCWGGTHTVKYNPITKKWSYGTQCTRNSIKNSHYCLTHYKLSLKKKGLPHGNFHQNVPHPHYIKYKQKIEKYFHIKN